MSTPRPTRRANGDGSVFYDRNGKRWVATITSRDGHRHKRSAPTQKAAKAKLRELLDEERTYGSIASPQATLGELMQVWKDKRLAAERIAPSTRANKLWACVWIERHLGSVRLDQLDADRIERALAAMADGGLGLESLIKVRSVLNQICNFGERRGLLRKNPVGVVELPAGLAPSDDGRALTPDQAKQLLAVSSQHRLHALWCTMMMLGLRPGEALGLTWDDLDFSSNVLHIRRALRIGSDGPEITEQLKTARSRRSLEMPAPLVAALVGHRAVQAAERRHADEAWSTQWPDLVFTTHFGTPINPSNLRRDFSQLTTSAGLGHWTPNELRHTAVSLLSADGLPLERIADVVGHTGTRMTAKVYRHVLTPSVNHAVGPMNQLFGTEHPTATEMAG
jgi:integrase